MKRARRKETFKELEARWYARLKREGFIDIENVVNPERPLKEWHSRKFATERSRMRQAEREKYDKQITDFVLANQINEICTLITKHGNVTIGPKKAKKIIELHRDGLTERTIAKKVRCGKKCVHITLKKAKEWMKVA